MSCSRLRGRTCNSCAGARALAHRFHGLENLGRDLGELVEVQRESFRKPGDGEQPAAMHAAPPSAGEAEPAPRADDDGRPPDPAVPLPAAPSVWHLAEHGQIRWRAVRRAAAV